MQTFLPLPSFQESARVLDRARLGNQRMECKQIFNSLKRIVGGWSNHPATKMWQGYEVALCFYAIEVCKEWRRRGYKDAQLEFFENSLIRLDGRLVLPSWFGEDNFHASHRSNLLRKNPKWYGQFGWKEGPNLPYVWPKPTIEKSNQEES